MDDLIFHKERYELEGQSQAFSQEDP
jgi:hypothetical protein